MHFSQLLYIVIDDSMEISLEKLNLLYFPTSFILLSSPILLISLFLSFFLFGSLFNMFNSVFQSTLITLGTNIQLIILIFSSPLSLLNFPSSFLLFILSSFSFLSDFALFSISPSSTLLYFSSSSPSSTLLYFFSLYFSFTFLFRNQP